MRTVLRSEIRPGAYCDSIVLLRLQLALREREGVLDAGVVMGTETNRDLLESNGLLTAEAAQAGDQDLILVIAADNEERAQAALDGVDELLRERRSGGEGGYRPRSLEAASRQLPQADWVTISVPGRHAGRVAREALDLGRHVFLFSDNVPLAEEVELKRKARDQGLFLMGPDCGTAIVGGVGLGFANRVRPGSVGLVGASGTGLQAVTSRLHALGSGVSHALGTGGRDLHDEVGGLTALSGIEMLGRDPRTRVVVLISKPPGPAVTARLLAAAAATGKPVVVSFAGFAPPARRIGHLHFATSLSQTAELAAELAAEAPERIAASAKATAGAEARSPGDLRGLFSGGTLAYEMVQGLQSFLAPLHTNVPLGHALRLEDPTRSQGHTIVDLGADELTVGRLHPMIDPDLRLRRLRQEVDDKEAGTLLLDVVLGDASHPDPAAGLEPIIADVCQRRDREGQDLEIIVLLVGTDEDPQDLEAQEERFESAGARVFRDPETALAAIASRYLGAGRASGTAAVVLERPRAVLNVGLDTLHDSFVAQGVESLDLDWQPPAAGKEHLLDILAKMKG